MITKKFNSLKLTSEIIQIISSRIGDAFVDDATNRRLGNGAAFYGKRKSAFYGEQDFMKKEDKDMPDPTEDYQGPKKVSHAKRTLCAIHFSVSLIVF